MIESIEILERGTQPEDCTHQELLSWLTFLRPSNTHETYAEAAAQVRIAIVQGLMRGITMDEFEQDAMFALAVRQYTASSEILDSNPRYETVARAFMDDHPYLFDRVDQQMHEWEKPLSRRPVHECTILARINFPENCVGLARVHFAPTTYPMNRVFAYVAHAAATRAIYDVSRMQDDEGSGHLPLEIVHYCTLDSEILCSQSDTFVCDFDCDRDD